MSSQDAANRSGRGPSRRRVKYSAKIEEMEGRVLLSRAHHIRPAFHRAAHIRATSHPRDGSSWQGHTLLAPLNVTHRRQGLAGRGRMLLARLNATGGTPSASSAPVINVQSTFNIAPSVSGGS